VPADPWISVRDLAFRYPLPSRSEPIPSHLTLHDVSFSLPTGKRLAVVGPSGSGKTTLLNLLLRFWDFQEGEIRFGGKDIHAFDPDELRSQLAVVSQHTHLFNASLRENLLIAKPNATQADIVRATQAARIHELIKNLPEGYGTFLGEQGMRLSGGERQRIAIARALLKDAPILLMDEPTANLDSITEVAILESIHKLMRGRSTLLATHRLVGMDWMDEILVLRDGEIIERGTHTELLAKGGLYRRMWEIQEQLLA
jgi:ATP-binding cassette subfamily C protein CydC